MRGVYRVATQDMVLYEGSSLEEATAMYRLHEAAHYHVTLSFVLEENK